MADRTSPEPSEDLRELSAVFDELAAERAAAQAELDRLRRRDELILNSAMEGICGLDRAGRITFANRAAGDLLGYAPSELAGQEIEVILGPASRASGSPIRLTLADGRVRSVRKEIFRRRNASTFEVEFACTPIVEDAIIVGAVITFRDVTEQRAVERIKDEFVSIVSHELRTPLTSIRGSLGLIASGMLGEVSDKAKRMLDIAVVNTDRLVRLINDILDIERMESGRVTLNKQPCNAADLMSQAAETMRSMAVESGVTLAVTPVWAPLDADPDRLLQMLTNLLSNAIRFSDWGGRVWLTAERRVGEIVFTVGDQGRGIPAEHLETIFQRFEQVDASDSREKGGTGLGLAICRSIAEQHGGRIWATSSAGEGSLFMCSVPAPNRAETRKGSLGEGEIRTATVSAMVVGRDDQITAGVASALKRCGATVFRPGDGREVARIMDGGAPNLVLIDAGMPVREGFDAVEWLLKTKRLIPVRAVAFGVTEIDGSQRRRLESAGVELWGPADLEADAVDALAAALVRDATTTQGAVR